MPLQMQHWSVMSDIPTVMIYPLVQIKSAIMLFATSNDEDIIHSSMSSGSCLKESTDFTQIVFGALLSFCCNSCHNNIIQSATVNVTELNGRALECSCDCGAYWEGVRVHCRLWWVDNEVAQGEAEALRSAPQMDSLGTRPREGLLLSLQVEKACRGITPLWHVILGGEKRARERE